MIISRFLILPSPFFFYLFGFLIDYEKGCVKEKDSRKCRSEQKSRKSRENVEEKVGKANVGPTRKGSKS